MRSSYKVITKSPAPVHKSSFRTESARETWTANAQPLYRPNPTPTAHKPTSNNENNLTIENLKLSREMARIKRENKRFIEEVTRLNDLIEQMKNIDDDELLMIEKIQTKEIYGKAQKVKFSHLQKETEKIRIEIDRLKVVVQNRDGQLGEKSQENQKLREEIEKIRREKRVTNVVYKTEYKTPPDMTQQLRTKETLLRQRDQEITRLKSMPAKVQTVAYLFHYFRDFFI